MQHFRNLLLKLPPYLLSVVCLLLICYLTLVPKPLPENDLGLIPGLDKIVHAIMFFGLTLCIITDNARRRIISLPQSQPVTRLGRITAMVVAAVTGGVIEILQQEMHIGRSGDWIDLLSDWSGVIVAGFFAPMIIRLIFFKRK